MVCGAGDCAPTPTVNTGGSAGVSTSCAVVETNSVTGILIGLPTAAAPMAGLVAVMVMVPVQVGVAAVRPVVTMETLRVSEVTLLGKLLLAFTACSHVEPQLVGTNDAE